MKNKIGTDINEITERTKHSIRLFMVGYIKRTEYKESRTMPDKLWVNRQGRAETKLGRWSDICENGIQNN